MSKREAESRRAVDILERLRRDRSVTTRERNWALDLTISLLRARALDAGEDE